MKVTGNVKFLPAGTTQYVVDGNDGEINVDTSTSAITIILPNIFNSGYENSDKGFVINDYSGNAGTNNITLVASNNTVNSQASVVISVNGGTAKCSIAGQSEWFVITEPATGGMSGLLTPNYIPKAATSSTLNDSVIYQNGTKIGIGTINPLTNLHVSGNSAVAAITSSRYSSDINAAGFAGLKARGTEASPSAVLSGDLMLTVSAFGYNSGSAFSAATGAMVFYAKENFTASANGTAFKLSTTPIGATVDVFSFGINENGDVSIGDQALSPTARLYVKGIAATPSTYALKIENSVSTNLLSIANNGSAVFASILDGSGGGVDNYGYSSTTGGLQVSYNSFSGSSIFNFSTGGSIGTAINEVSGFYQISSSNRISFKTKADSKTHLYMGSGGQIGVGGDFFTTSASLHVQGIDATSSNYALKVDNSASTALLYVQNDGKVGVGIATPLLRFSVKPTANLDGIILQEDASNFYGHLGKDGTNGFLFLYSGSTAKVALNGPTYSTGVDYINTGLDLGIGLNAASAKVHIYGAGATSATYALKVDNSAFGNVFYARNDGLLSAPMLPTSNAGLSTGDMYVDTAAQILANGDKVVGWKV